MRTGSNRKWNWNDMGRRRKSSTFEDLMAVLMLLPRKISLVLIVPAYFGFHWLSKLPPPQIHDVRELGASIGPTYARILGLYLQYIAPFMLALAAFANVIHKRRRAALLAQTEQRGVDAPLLAMNWRQFERLVAAYFEREGYEVRMTPDGADGGVDVVLKRGGETFLVQCKQWRATKVGVSVVRELFGVMAARGATGAFVVSIGPYTRDAQAFTEGRNIKLIDAHQLLKTPPAAANAAPVATTTQPQPRVAPHAPTAAAGTAPAPSMAATQTATQIPVATPASTCPRCGSALVQRVAKQGPNAGRAFLGCSTYPACRYIGPIAGTATPAKSA